MSTTTLFAELSKLGAGDFEHLSGSLEEHLISTSELLRCWGAGNILQTAGLYHAAYGTAGFTASMVDTNQRAKIVAIIGAPAENIVYLYCACDRTVVWPAIDGCQGVEFQNRFTNQISLFKPQELRDFCELTVANEVQIAMDDPLFAQESGLYMSKLFTHMDANLSEKASLAWRDLFL